MTRRVVVTGLGVVAPNGVGTEAFWDNVTRGINGVSEYDWGPRFGLASRVMGAVDGFDGDGRQVAFALAASAMAVADAGLEGAALDRDRFGVTIATAIGDAAAMERNLLAPRVEAGFARAFDFGRAAAEAATRFGARGAATTLSTGCTAGIDALGFGLDEIREGRAEVMLAGASEAPLCPLAVGSFEALGALSTRACADPREASAPFSADRDGFVIGEGAAMLVLEAAEHAEARGARAYAELAGYASVNNAFHMTDLAADGAAMARCMELALADAGCDAEAIDHVAAHGSSTPQNDLHETAAIKRVFGARAARIPVNSLKSMTGHALAAANAIEAAALCLEIRHALLHPTINHRRAAAECDLDYVTDGARAVRIGAALKLASGFSGIHSVLVLRAA